MKKILLAIALLFVLVGCIEIIEEPTVRNPEIELEVIGELEQIYEETEDLDDVTFKVIFKYFEENEIDIEDVKIQWFEGNQEIEDHLDLQEYTLEIKHTLNTSVKVVVSFTLEGEQETLEDSRVVSVIERPTQISLTNNIDHNHVIGLIFGNDNEVIYTAQILGNLTHTEGLWTIQMVGFNQEVLEEEVIRIVLEDEMVISNGIGTVTLNHTFEKAGNYVIHFDIGRYRSNYQHVVITYGAFEIETSGDLTQTENYGERTLTVLEVSEHLGEGTYRWYLDGEALLEHDNKLSITHDNNAIKGYLYHAEFIPNDSQIEVQKTEPVLIANAIEVNGKEALDSAIDDGYEAVVLTEDIMKIGETLNINRGMTIIGNGHTISSAGISIVINVRADHVYFKDLTIEESGRYNIVYTRSKNGYLENVILDSPGTGGGMTDLSAGLYVLESEVTVKNLEVKNGTNTGVRIDSPYTEGQTVIPSVLTILGSFNHGGVLLPVGSGNSRANDITINAIGFVQFVIPIQSSDGMAIRRWSNESEAITWTLNDPNKTTYQIGEAVDLFGITIDVGFAGTTINGDLELVYIFLSMFNQYGTLEILSLDGQDLDIIYYIVDHNENGKYDNLEYTFGNDLLLFTTDAEGQDYVRPFLPEEAGDYLIRITIGGEMVLGTFRVNVQ